MANTSDISKGCFLRFNNELVQVLEYEHRTPGNLRAFYQVKMRNIKTGKLVEHRFRAGEDVELVRVDVNDYSYLYDEGPSLVLMDSVTYEQISVDKLLFGDSLKFLKEGMVIKVSFDGDTPIYAEPPTSVELEVTYTEPGIRGDTATKTLKPATLETGAEIRVPLFIEIGEKIKVDTRTGDYMERVKS
ncbi:elongation factor P [Sporocytophaga myxococcoides]|uniref:elongation factor P n=1 Tax=Sporocytophaga myxococcoides TaxID=153721 RepID=UPI000405180B|nr:elongation factor P [Sporocytophaga myxococcoides]